MKKKLESLASLIIYHSCQVEGSFLWISVQKDMGDINN